MRRREFIKNGAAAVVGAAGAGSAFAAPWDGASGGGRATVPARETGAVAVAAGGQQQRFKLNYAPHFGMFRNSAGEDRLEDVAADDGAPALHEDGTRLG